MKKLNILLLFLISLNSCTQKIKEPQDIGKVIFNILREDMTSMSKEEYSEKLLSIDEAKSVGINSEEYSNTISDNYANFIEKSKLENIDWNNIEYLDFEYKIKRGRPSEVIRGIVSFKYKDKINKVKIFAVWTGEEYRFCEISGPY